MFGYNERSCSGLVCNNLEQSLSGYQREIVTLGLNLKAVCGAFAGLFCRMRLSAALTECQRWLALVAA